MVVEPSRRKPVGRRRLSRGFTLLEVLAVVFVMAVLFAIVVPRIINLSRRSRESRLRADLHMLRRAIDQFQGDTGLLPATLNDLMAAGASELSTTNVDPTLYQGPYLETADGALPKDIFTGAADWSYNPATGAIHSASSLTALDGTAYSTW